MEIHDFLPKYPNIVNKDEDIMNPYDEGFYTSIFKKREFYDERLPEIEDIPTEKRYVNETSKNYCSFSFFSYNI